MATSALIRIYERNTLLVTIYKHWDGNTVGDTIKQIIKAGQCGNGIPANKRELGSFFNGAGCLASSVIAMLKQSPGDVYITNNVQPGDVNYVYEVRYKTEADGDIAFVKTL
jgi:hypothetical protein